MTPMERLLWAFIIFMLGAICGVCAVTPKMGCSLVCHNVGGYHFREEPPKCECMFP
jgi:hypothetical protein